MKLPSTTVLATLLVILVGSGCSSQAAVEPPSAPATAVDLVADPQSGETLLAAPPNGWSQTGGTRSGALSLAEYVPAATSGDDAAEGGWTEKITLERLDGTPVPDPLEFLEGLRADHLAGCRKGSYTPIAAAEENGYPTAVAMLVCPKLEVIDAGQVTLIKVIQGDAAFYTITRAIRSKAWSTLIDERPDQEASPADKDVDKPPAPPVDPTLIGGASAWLRAISVCNPGTPEHPCPVATGS